jgi:hypothetical protein
MPYCPTCRAEHRPGFTRCAECDVELVDALPAEAAPDDEAGEWVNVYTGVSRAAEMVEANLASLGIPSARLPGEALETFPIGVMGSPNEFSLWTVSVPQSAHAGRREQIERAVSLGRLAAGEEDPEAAAQAEEDYDVRACPSCVLYFHDNYTACPGCGAELVPAVECFEDGQTAPDRVVVAHGPQEAMKALAARFQAARFQAEASEVEDWPVTITDLPWDELTGRTAEAEAILRAGR